MYVVSSLCTAVPPSARHLFDTPKREGEYPQDIVDPSTRLNIDERAVQIRFPEIRLDHAIKLYPHIGVPDWKEATVVLQPEDAMHLDEGLT